MRFREIVGQSAAVATLRTGIVRDAVPQVYLFVGAEGVGKTTTALAFAQSLCCKNRPSDDSESCGICVNCTRIAAEQHPDVVRIAPDGEQTKMWQFWSRPGHPPGALETLPFAPVAAPRRFYLIEKAETLNEESANSLLKALEEPPPYANFVLCAPTPNSVLPTILSRCQFVRFRAVATTEIADLLIRERSLPPSEARVLAAYSQGAPGRALRLADTSELRDQREALLTLAARIAASPGIAAFKLAEELRDAAKTKVKKGDEEEGDRTQRGDLNRAMDVLAAWYSDLMALNVCGENAPIIHEDKRAILLEAMRRYPSAQITECIETLFTFRRHITRNANAQLATEVLLLKLIPRKGSAGR